MLKPGLGLELQFLQGSNDFICFQAYCYYSKYKVQNIARIIMFPAPVILVIIYAAVLVGFNLIAVHNPFNGGLAVYLIGICL